MGARVETSLWRAILRTCRRYDTAPQFRVMLSAPRDREFNMVMAAWEPIPAPSDHVTPERHAAAALDSAIRRLCGGARLFPGECSRSTTLVASLTESVRAVLAGQKKEMNLDAGFALLRRLEAGLCLGERALSPPCPSRACSAVEGTISASMAGAPKSGDVLVSHPLLRRDTVLLLSADGLDGFAFGLVTNNPTGSHIGTGPLLRGRGQTVGPPARSVGEVWTTGRRILKDELASQRRTRDQGIEPFAAHTIFNGGPDGTANLTMCHPYGQVRGCAVVTPGLYYGGDLEHAASLIREGVASAEHFIFFRGRVDWRPGELRGEIELGEWAAVREHRSSSVNVCSDGSAGGSDTKEACWPPLGLAQSVTTEPPPTNGVDSEVEQRRRLRYEIWAAAVNAVTATPEVGNSASERLRSWLWMRPRISAEEIDDIAALQTRGDARECSPPPWRTREDWSADRP